jgi:beta-RFAP synthase
MVSIQTASRLHFGLLSLTGESASATGVAGQTTFSERRFGGVGLMVDRPGVQIQAEPAATWSASGPLAERVLGCARRFVACTRTRKSDATPCRFLIGESSPEHVGLGTGTQVGLAVGKCLAAVYGLRMSAAEIAASVGRGERSAVGIHGFEQGGFLVEGGQARPGTLGPLVARCALPSDWRVVLARPLGVTGTHGVNERSLMVTLHDSKRTADPLSRLVLLGMLPALVENDVDGFGEALFEFNVRAGEPFAAIQGGTYSSPAVAELVSFLRAHNARGVGQSSWGPTVFAVVGGEDGAKELAGALRQKYATVCEVLVTRAADQGARIEADNAGAL